MDLMVGCPVRDRDWILPHWFDHVAVAAQRAGFAWRAVLVVPSSQDTALLARLAGEHRVPLEIIVKDGELDTGRRDWMKRRRFEWMAELRNELLTWVSAIDSGLFWSVDSDILVHPDSLTGALEAMETRGFDAVGSKCYMEPRHRKAPNYSTTLRSAGIHRVDAAGVFRVAALMALKLMSPAAYNVSYTFDYNGEDFGWSQQAKTAGLSLGWDGRHCSKHVMERYVHLDGAHHRCRDTACPQLVEAVTTIDPRCGY